MRRRLDRVDKALLRGAEENGAIPPLVILDEMEKAIANMRTKNYDEFGHSTLMADLYGCVVSPGFRRVWTAPIAERIDT